MKVLVYTPTWAIDGTVALHPKVRAAIERAVAHTRQSMSADMDWVVGLENPWPIPDHRNVLHQYQRARAMTLDAGAGYDALLTIEHDNLLPDEAALDRLLATPGDVVYAPYLLRHGMAMLSTWQYVNDRNLGMSLSNYPAELAQAREAVIWRICGCGMGCTLFRRRALETVPFEPSSDTNPCPDLGFAVQALRAGLVSVGRFDVPVAHYSRGRWLHTYEESEMKYIARDTGQAIGDGRIIKMVRGGELDLTAAEAADLARLGKIEPVGSQEAIEADAGDEETDRIAVEELIADDAARAAARSAEQVASTPPPSRRNRDKTPKGGK